MTEFIFTYIEDYKKFKLYTKSDKNSLCISYHDLLLNQQKYFLDVEDKNSLRVLEIEIYDLIYQYLRKLKLDNKYTKIYYHIDYLDYNIVNFMSNNIKNRCKIIGLNNLEFSLKLVDNIDIDFLECQERKLDPQIKVS